MMTLMVILSMVDTKGFTLVLGDKSMKHTKGLTLVLGDKSMKHTKGFTLVLSDKSMKHTKGFTLVLCQKPSPSGALLGSSIGDENYHSHENCIQIWFFY